MVRLPRIFHHYDKELHAIFYFGTTMTITFLFPKRSILATTGLVLFGIIIEFAQEFSNKISKRIIGKAIHGRFDIDDVKYNLIGIFLGLLIFLLYRLILKLKQ
jgi:glycopeptide antibiotics resistance protein